MSTTIATTTTEKERIVIPAGPDRLALSGARSDIADWHRDLIRDGYAVVKGAVPKERAEKYADQMMAWLEGLYVLQLSDS
jgi:hypothetical protein